MNRSVAAARRLATESSTVGDRIAGVDLGSNSFHLIMAERRGRGVEIKNRVKETVRLRSGLSDNGDLAPEARSRALACLERFGDHLRAFGVRRVRAVGTDAIRRAADSRDFLEAAEQALGHPIEVISGYEEARLIYAGATPVGVESAGHRLVVDIGGGSTELILGEGARPASLVSLGMGSVSLTERCFPDDRVTQDAVERAMALARGELAGVTAAFRPQGRVSALGASGTIKSIAQLAEARGWSPQGVTPAALESLTRLLVEKGAARTNDFPELNPDRVPILPGGLAILRAVFQVLGIERMTLAPGALREGLLADMADRMSNRDIRHRTVTAMLRRYRLDRRHGRAVAATAVTAWEAVASAWSLEVCPETRDYLRWAACLHEIGLSVSHSQHHQHGAYLLAHADMAGFSRDDQAMLSVLIHLQRKKLSRRFLDSVSPRYRSCCLPIAALLRVAIALHRARMPAPPVRFEADQPGVWRLHLPRDWRQLHPLLVDDLHEEVAYQKAAGLSLELT